MATIRKELRTRATPEQVWTADFLPHEAATVVDPMISEGMTAMQRALDALAA